MAGDAFFDSYGARQINPNAHPYDSSSKSSPGDKTDDTKYVLLPGQNFLRPWLAIRNGPAFMWPLGIEGYQLVIDPSVAIHKFIGQNGVEVDVIHSGQENITLNGSFPGKSGPAAYLALRDIVHRDATDEGKLLYVPYLAERVQRVTVLHAQFNHSEDQRGTDMSYSIEFVRQGVAGSVPPTVLSDAVAQPTTDQASWSSSHAFVTTSKIRTARQIAKVKYGAGTKWNLIYLKNLTLYDLKLKLPVPRVPDTALAIGTRVNY